MDPNAVLVHHDSDAAIAEATAAFLRAGSRYNVDVKEGCIANATLLETLRRALSADAAVVLLSERSVASRASAAEWTAAFHEAPETRVASLSLEPCAVPALLRRRRIIDASDLASSRRELKRWLIDAPPPAAYALPPPALEPVSAAELERLRKSLSDSPGVERLPVAPALVSAFVHAHAADFETVIWIDCAARSEENLYAELGARLGISVEGPLDADRAAVERALRGPRVLLALQNLAGAALAPAAGPLCSILTTESAPPSAIDPEPLIDALRHWRADPAAALQLLPAAGLAWSATAGHAWDSAKQIGRLCFLLTNHQRRFAEAAVWLDRLIAAAIHHRDRAVAIDSARDKSWIVERWGSAAPVIASESTPPVQLTLFESPVALGASSSI